MKQIIAFLASGVIPTFVPVCALLTLPFCVAEKYIPQDVRTSFSYGIRFFQLVLDPNLQVRPNRVAREVESVPVVESTVTSMAFAAEPECEQMPVKAVVEPLTITASIDMHVRNELHKAQSEMKHLEFMRELKIAVPAEKFEIAFEHALKNMEAKLQRVENKKKDHKALRIRLKKLQIPA